jgi:hypothetical protein
MTPDIVMGIVAVATLLGGIYIGSVKLMLRPIEVLIDANTKAMEGLQAIASDHKATLDDHSIAINDHAKELARITQLHHIRGCDEPDR